MQIERRIHVRDGYLKTVARRFPAAGGPSIPIALPAFLDGTTLLAPGGVRRVVLDTLPTVLEICRRIAPWADVVFTPRLLTTIDRDHSENAEFLLVDGVEFKEFLGEYDRRKKTITIAMLHPVGIYKTAVHECWHAIDTRLSEEWKSRIDANLSTPFYGDGFSYWNDQEERRCRAFEAWCLRIINGLPATYVRTEIDEIFALAWSGELGDELLGYPQPVEESA